MTSESCVLEKNKFTGYLMPEKNYIIGVSDIRSDTNNVLTEGIANKLKIPSITNIIPFVLDNLIDFTLNDKCSISQVLDLYNCILDQIDINLSIYKSGGVFDLTPLGMVAAVYFQILNRKSTSKDTLECLERLTEKAITISCRFTHLIITFPFKGSNLYFHNSAMSNMISGIHCRYEDSIESSIIRLPEVLSSDEERIDFTHHIITLL